MKDVVKVSISGFSFTLDVESYRILSDYLGELNNHYKDEKYGVEIVSDIEERVAELLMERGAKERVVSVEDVEQIIAILGHPSEIDGNTSPNGGIPNGGAENSGLSGARRKRLFRDVESKLISGVCSGLAHYFNIDVALVRIIFLLLLLFSPLEWLADKLDLLHKTGGPSGFVFLLYIILWIAIPAARSVEQRCAMRGVGAGVDDIAGRVKNGERRERGYYGSTAHRVTEFIGSAIRIGVGVILLGGGLSGLLVGMLIFLGIDIAADFYLADFMINFSDELAGNFWLKLGAAMSCSLPFIGMIYGGILLLFNLKSPNWHPGLVILLLWLVSLFVTIIYSISLVNPLEEAFNERDVIIRNFAEEYDTIYVELENYAGLELEDISRYVERDSATMKLELRGENEYGERRFVKYPVVKIRRIGADGSQVETGNIECRFNTFNFGTYSISGCTIDDIYRQEDSLIRVYPKVCFTRRGAERIRDTILLNLEEGVSVKFLE